MPDPSSDAEAPSPEKGSAELASAGDTKSPTPSRNSNLFWILDICAVLFWCYATTKVFAFDVDIYIFRKILPDYEWILQFKLVIALIILSALFLFFNKISILLHAIYIALFPLIAVVWKIPKIIYKKKQWVLAFALVNTTTSFFATIRYNIIMSAAFLASAAVIFTASNQKLLWIAMCIIVVALYSVYVHRFILAIRPLSVFRVHDKVVCWLSDFATKALAPDPKLSRKPYSKLTTQQADNWKTNLQLSILMSRGCLFLAKKLKHYQMSGAGACSAALIVLFLVTLTVIVFAIANFALYKIDPSNFTASEPVSAFTFLYYSFSTIVFQKLTELAPVTDPSRMLWMLEGMSALLFALIFVSVMFSTRNQRQTEQINEVIESISSHGKKMETFVIDKYKFSSIDDALSELTRLKAGMISFIYRLSADL